MIVVFFTWEILGLVLLGCWIGDVYDNYKNRPKPIIEYRTRINAGREK